MERVLIEEIPTWLAVPLIVTLSLTTIYRAYILPNYKKDQDNGKES